jgi:predicted phosphodiesterase
MNILSILSVSAVLLSVMPGNTGEVMNHQGTVSQELRNDNPLFSFGIIADVQYADCEPAGTRFYNLSTGKLREAFTVFRKEKVDFAVNLGDLIDRDFNSYAPVMKIIDSAGLKTFSIMGNHDYSVDPNLKSSIPLTTESAEGYYAIIYRNFRLVFLNGNEISTYASSDPGKITEAKKLIADLKEKGAVNAVEWNGGIGPEQTKWLIQQLDEANSQNEHVMILCHFPVAPENIHNLFNYNKILELLARYRNIVAWMNGHNHAGNYALVNGMHCVTFRGMVETIDSNSFAIVKVYNDRLVISGYGRENPRELGF